MRKLLVMMLSLALCFSMSVTALAADTSAGSEASETDYDVFVYVDDTGESLVVELQALNAVSDGVVTITYDTSVVSVEESDVVANMDAVDKYSVNAEEAGTLRISWISEEEATGTLFTLGFVLSDGSDIENAAFLLSGDVRNADGALMLLKNDAIEEAEKEVLQSVYNTSLTLDEENYTEESWTALVEAQEAALAVLTNIESTQEEVNAALAVLNAAYLGLIPQKEAASEVDKSALRAFYDATLLLTESDYTSESWAVLSEALKTAKEVLDNEGATQEEADEAWQKLLDAFRALALNPDADPDADPDNVNLDALLLLYEASLKLTESDYTSDSWAALVSAQAGALDVLNAMEPTQEEADNALTTLLDALNGLKTPSYSSDDSGETTATTVDKAALQAAYDASVPLTESKYTPASWATFVETRAAALKVLEDGNATQAQVNEALAALLDAMNGLVTLVDPATTGDTSSIGLWIAIAVIAAAAIAAVTVVYKKRMGKGGER